MDMGKHLRPPPYTKRKSRRRRGGFPKGRAHQMLVQCQMAHLGNIHTRKVIWGKQVTVRNIYAYTYTHVITIDEKSGYEFEGERKGVHGRVWREERGKRTEK